MSASAAPASATSAGYGAPIRRATAASAAPAYQHRDDDLEHLHSASCRQNVALHARRARD
jgi:hypothetical protein